MWVAIFITTLISMYGRDSAISTFQAGPFDSYEECVEQSEKVALPTNDGHYIQSKFTCIRIGVSK